MLNMVMSICLFGEQVVEVGSLEITCLASNRVSHPDSFTSSGVMFRSPKAMSGRLKSLLGMLI